MSEAIKEGLAEEVTGRVWKYVMDDGLWSRMKGHCLDTNPFIRLDDDGREMVKCPRCMQEMLSMNYTTFNMEPVAVPWSCSVQKCPNCHHIFAFVRG